MTSSVEPKSFLIPAFKITQPIGEFYIGCMNYKQLIEVTYVDVRRIQGERGFETYLGIQRPLDEKRVVKISQYVKTVDACFPTAVILAVPGVCASFDGDTRLLTISEYLDPEEGDDQIALGAIAKVLDGQHRICIAPL